ncbi:MAG: C4-type zinc ribbon domain-containing protein [Verrucomicrobiota bacterium]|nr:C4-type zinc ribbon domain-containing protein [Verrucomicrobiota bacterium]
MADPLIEKLLALQERDVRCDAIKQQLESIPSDIAKLEAEINSGLSRLDQARTALKEMEARRKTLEVEVGVAQDQIVKKKTSQIAVKKNDEYQALELEIAHLKAGIGKIEDDEIELMMSIEDSKTKLVGIETAVNSEKKILQAQIEHLRSVEKSIKADIAGAEAAVVEAEKDVPAKGMSVYRYVKSRAKRPPYVVAIKDHKCMGCHLKVATDVVTQTRSHPADLPRCDSCGRIVYYVAERFD